MANDDLLKIGLGVTLVAGLGFAGYLYFTSNASKTTTGNANPGTTQTTTTTTTTTQPSSSNTSSTNQPSTTGSSGSTTTNTPPANPPSSPTFSLTDITASSTTGQPGVSLTGNFGGTANGQNVIPTQELIDWGDGQTQTIQAIQVSNLYHVYSGSGTYTVKVTSVFASGQQLSATANITLTARQPQTTPNQPANQPAYASNTYTGSGTQSAPYPVWRGWSGPGYYIYAADGTQTGYMATIDQLNTFNLNKTGSNIVGYAPAGSQVVSSGTNPPVGTNPANNSSPSPQSGQPTITITPSTIARTDGASVTIAGSGFQPGETGSLQNYTPPYSGGAGVSGFTCDSSGSFSIKVNYYYNSSQVSGLAQAITNAGNQNFIYIRAYGYVTQAYSNSVTLYFS